MNVWQRLCRMALFALVLPAAAGAVARADSGAPSTAWPWPAIPSCLADPSTVTGGITDRASPVCQVYDAILNEAADFELVSARRVNADLDGVLYPAFLPGTEVVRFVPGPALVQALGSANALVRVSRSAPGARFGSWWTTLHQVSDARGLLPPDRIRALLALTDSPTCIAFAGDVHREVRAYMGVVAPAFDEPGGAVEFWFPPDAVEASRTAPLSGTTGC